MLLLQVITQLDEGNWLLSSLVSQSTANSSTAMAIFIETDPAQPAKTLRMGGGQKWYGGGMHVHKKNITNTACYN